jgi:hypothetical protein
MKAKARTERKKAARPKDLPASAQTARAVKGGTRSGGEIVVSNDLGPDNVQKKHVAG